ncbi:glycosyl hydrolase family 3 N terminal domain-containing protein [Cytidiella melzeri]|nr:glycosyl hydrolase family 3 N terminal domain-containing protein [Cytidiella melzeri]
MATTRKICALLLVLPSLSAAAVAPSAATSALPSVTILSSSPGLSPVVPSSSSSSGFSSAALSASSTLLSLTSVLSSAVSSATLSASASLNATSSSFSNSASASSLSSASLNATLTSSVNASLPTASPTFNTGSGTETGPITVPITPISFQPFPTAVSPKGVAEFPSVDPSSPPPPSDAPGLGGHVPNFADAWDAAYSKAKALLAGGWSNEDKVALTTGVGWEGGLCVGNTPVVPNKFPGLCLEDSPLGVRDTDFVTAFPAAISAASTWNRTLLRTRGLFMGREHKGKGVNVALGPMMNMGRVAQGGRNWEGFGADPFLSGEGAYETILGMQAGGVQACAKHFINNEQEHERTMESSNVDDRTQHEIYAHPFMRSVMAGVASVMCSYNLVNDTYACENEKMLDDVMKREFGFRGYIMSDWSAQHSTMSAAVGLDMTMPGDITFSSGTSWWGQNLTDFVANGTIAQARLDDMATRILASWYLLKQDGPYPKVSFNAFNPLDTVNNSHVDVQDDHFTVVRAIGAAGAVLLKNENNALPLKLGTGFVRSIVVVGNDGGPALRGPNGFGDRGGDDGVLAMGWGSGTAQFPYLIDPLEAIQSRARKGQTSSERALVSWWLNNFDTNGAASAVAGQDAAIVFVNADSGEDYITVDGNEGDRKNLTLWGNADNLITAVANTNKNTIVVAHSVGPSIIEPWIDHPNVTAVIWAGIPGQEAGNSITDVLFGDVNPSGRLPYTIAKQLTDYPAGLVLGGGATTYLSIPYTEGLLIDYRWFDAKNISPRFEFGFGLSYSEFQYFNLETSLISQPDSDSKALESAWAAGKPTPIAEGSTTALWLHRPLVKVQFEVQNTGGVDGGEIPQLYVHHPPSAGEPPSVLKGFTDVFLPKNEKKTVTLTLSRYDLSIWDVVHQGWVKPTGKITFSVGASSRDFRLAGTVPV